MYHQLSKVTGRVVAATHLQSPLFPVAPIALQRVEPPTIQYNTAQLSTVTEASSSGSGPRNLIPGTNTPYPPLSDAFRKRQQLFQREDDVPVHLKGGPLDSLLYRLTLGLCIVGLAGIFHTVYGHAFPKKQD
ncbi:uncharacterized protein LOC113512502 [Galleria mellonella]|uniref:Cytochrome c oxidase subunit 7A2 n=1 Tax=Galleria mellonella TaxID=7137 RepID=A0A3G1T1N7_GALME|nr:uncharacterized protein LOC113512502 [Galleria mellonella]AXY94901.1 cytochrome c oxidase subunit 7A2 [Galleria mellonella]